MDRHQKGEKKNVEKNLLNNQKEVNSDQIVKERENKTKTEDVTQTKGHDFEDYYLKEELLMGLVKKGFDKPSPVQEECIPLALAGNNIIARAKNGTGKTGAYVIPILEKIDNKKNAVQAMILIPTRELALQVSSFIKELSIYLGIECMISTGGTSFKEDIMRLNNTVHVIVGTPGRIYDLMKKRILETSQCDILVLDEADKLLSVDFIPIIEKIINKMNSSKQMMLFSATFPMSVKQFKDKYMAQSSVVNLMEELTLKGITQYYVYLEDKQKVVCLNVLFTKLNLQQCIIFCNSTLRVELLAKKITELDYSCYYIHAKMSQQDRNNVFHNFRKGVGNYGDINLKGDVW